MLIIYVKLFLRGRLHTRYSRYMVFKINLGRFRFTFFLSLSSLSFFLFLLSSFFFPFYFFPPPLFSLILSLSLLFFLSFYNLSLLPLFLLSLSLCHHLPSLTFFSLAVIQRAQLGIWSEEVRSICCLMQPSASVVL